MHNLVCKFNFNDDDDDESLLFDRPIRPLQSYGPLANELVITLSQKMEFKFWTTLDFRSCLLFYSYGVVGLFLGDLKHK